ncbi:6-phosphofructo-2-kinase [Metarhizium acridum]|nr:6-phosphofructo-2-kinase [Metarhizium acridum]
MQNQFGVASSRSSTSPTSSEPEQHFAVQPPSHSSDVASYSHSPLQSHGTTQCYSMSAPVAIPAIASAVRMMKDLTDTPPLSQSVNSTAPSSPRIPPLRQNSGSQTPRVRPHATTLNIPGMTRSRVSPDGRIPQRDVAAKLVIVMVGLPARGKSYITKKLQRYLSWQQHESRIFNVGNRRRNAAGIKSSARANSGQEHQALDPPVEAATILLNGVPATNNDIPPDQAEPTTLNLNSTNGEPQEEVDQSAKFFDPNNEKAAAMRNQVAMETLDELLDYLLNQGGAVGILDATNSTIKRRQQVVDRIREREPKLGILFIENPVKSLEDFKARVAAYASAYVPLGEYEEDNDLQYIQKAYPAPPERFPLSGGISTYLSSFNLSPRQIWITRHGQSVDNELGKLGGDSILTERGHCYGLALYKFMTLKRKEWLMEQKSKLAQATFPPHPGDNTPPYPDMHKDLDEKNFCVWTSMLQRSVETAEYFDADDDYDVKNWEMLNELNTGQFEGMTYDEIARKYPEEFHKRAADKLNYIYPGVGGEGYLQVISRLRDMVREIERITDHVLIIGHRSVCRVLMAYFMDLTREDITDMDPYGIAFHAYKYNEANGWFDEMPNYRPQKAARGSV